MRQPPALRRAQTRPRPAKAGDTAAQIARINALTQAGRANWFALLAYLVFVFITVLGVQDADFFVPSRQTDLPLVGVAIPTASFFIFAPLLGSALYTYLHLHIRKVTEALTAPPVTVKGAALENPVASWLLNDMVLRWRHPDTDGNRAARPRPLDALATLTVIALVWLAGPFVLGWMWWRSWPAHDEYVTVLIAACLLAAAYAGITSWIKLRRDLSGDADPFPDLLRDLGLTFAAMGLLLVSLQQTELGVPQPDGTLRLAPADLSGLRASVLPPDQTDPTTARHRLRTEWCKRMDLEPGACGRTPSANVTPPPAQAANRDKWCARQGYDTGQPCQDRFSQLDDDFRAEWSALRTQTIAALDKPDFTGRDLRNADLSRASLTGMNFTRARLNGADFTGAHLERARFTCTPQTAPNFVGYCFAEAADLSGANLSAAQMEEANLFGAQLAGAVLEGTNLAGADLGEARMVGSHLRGAQLTGADLSRANIRSADLSYTQMAGTNLSEAHLDGAELSYTQMAGANLSDAHLDGAVLGYAKMKGANFRGAEMERASFNRAAMEGANFSFANMEGTYLQKAKMAGADLSEAKMAGADFSYAKMAGANLSGAKMAGVVLHDADMSGVNLSRAQMVGADLSWTDLGGADLSAARMHGIDLRRTQAQSSTWTRASIQGSLAHNADLRDAKNLRNDRFSPLIGNAATLLPNLSGPPEMAPFVCTCWTVDPPWLKDLVAILDRNYITEAELRNPDFGFFCDPNEEPRKTGTPWPFDREVPWGINSDGEGDWHHDRRRDAWAEAQPDRGPCPVP